MLVGVGKKILGFNSSEEQEEKQEDESQRTTHAQKQPYMLGGRELTQFEQNRFHEDSKEWLFQQREEAARMSMAEFEKKLREEFPSVDQSKINTIAGTLLSQDFDFSLTHLQLARCWVKNDLKVDEMQLLYLVFHNNMESATRDGVSVIRSSQGLEIRSNGDSKYIDSADEERVRRLVTVCEDEYPKTKDPFDGGGVQKATINTNFGKKTAWSEDDVTASPITPSDLQIEADDLKDFHAQLEKNFESQ